ncbi:MAG: radical SAM protein [Marinilabiliaceae bacterium]|nr:radical SAM protein [Marinilabiliaceae bacterium]
MICYGPVPSRRLGKSLGVNIIQSHKRCSYACIYCQVGKTSHYQTERTTEQDPQATADAVRIHLNKLQPDDRPDYLTLVSNGEPTLERNLGNIITLLKEFNYPIAVITNASLLYQDSVRDDLMMADWVSVKVDTHTEAVWHKINCPHRSLSFSQHEAGLRAFARDFRGILATETMLVEGVNDSHAELAHTASMIASLHPRTAYLSIPTRPPAHAWVKVPSEETLTAAYDIYSRQGISTELLTGFEGTHLAHTGNALEDIINTCTVHPIRQDAMDELLKKNGADASLTDFLVFGQYIKKITYQSETYYIRQFQR